MQSKKIKVVSLYIKEGKLSRETEKALIFNSRLGHKGIFIVPKSQIHEFKKVVTWFETWKGRISCRAYKLVVPLWWVQKHDSNIRRLGNDIKVINNHKYD